MSNVLGYLATLVRISGGLFSAFRLLSTARGYAATIVLIVAGLFLAYRLAGFTADAVRADPFEPIDARPVRVLNDANPGDDIQVIDGFCYEGEEPLAATVAVWAQPVATTADDASVVGAARRQVPLLGTSASPVELTIHPGCVGTQPTELTIPAITEPGFYIVTVRIAVTGEQGQEQIITSTSDPFEVLGRVPR